MCSMSSGSEGQTPYDRWLERVTRWQGLHVRIRLRSQKWDGLAAMDMWTSN